MCYVSLIPRLSETSTVGLGMRIVLCQSHSQTSTVGLGTRIVLCQSHSQTSTVGMGMRLVPCSRLSETSTVGLGTRLVPCMQGGGHLRSIIVSHSMTQSHRWLNHIVTRALGGSTWLV